MSWLNTGVSLIMSLLFLPEFLAHQFFGVFLDPGALWRHPGVKLNNRLYHSIHHSLLNNAECFYLISIITLEYMTIFPERPISREGENASEKNGRCYSEMVYWVYLSTIGYIYISTIGYSYPHLGIHLGINIWVYLHIYIWLYSHLAMYIIIWLYSYLDQKHGNKYLPSWI